MKALLLHDFADVTDPHHKLYKLEPGGPIDAEYIIVSATSADAKALGSRRASDGRSGYETRIFACSARGRVVDYNVWLHHYDGFDHDACLREAGYEPVVE